MANWRQHREFAEGVTLNMPRYRGNCPFCGGKNTFSATLEAGTLKYYCYKLGCDVRGTFDTDMTASEVKKILRPAPVKPDKEPDTMEIPQYVVQPRTEHDLFHKFVSRWRIDPEGLYYDVSQERIVFPIKYKGRIIDAVGRALGSKQPKWYRYTGESDYFTVGTGRVVIVVEDVVSALIAHKELPNVTAMAILGTSMNPKHFEKLSEYGLVIIALDPDALNKTIEYRRDIYLWTGLPTYAISLMDDIKYRNEEDLEALRKVTK